MIISTPDLRVASLTEHFATLEPQNPSIERMLCRSWFEALKVCNIWLGEKLPLISILGTTGYEEETFTNIYVCIAENRAKTKIGQKKLLISIHLKKSKKEPGRWKEETKSMVLQGERKMFAERSCRLSGNYFMSAFKLLDCGHPTGLGKKLKLGGFKMPKWAGFYRT